MSNKNSYSKFSRRNSGSMRGDYFFAPSNLNEKTKEEFKSLPENAATVVHKVANNKFLKKF